mgnify:CR=1 FL=1
MEREVVLLGAARTPIGRFMGALASLPAPALGAIAIREALCRAQVGDALPDEVLMGSVIQAGQGQAPARQAALQAGLPVTVGATTVNKVCGSGLKTVMMAAQAIRAGDARLIIAGGMENMSLGPYLLRQARSGYRLGNSELVDATIYDGLWCSFQNQHMGLAAEWIARQYGLSRAELDAYALRSHERAVVAQERGDFRAEIVPVEVPQRKGLPLCVDADECPRRDTSQEALARLQPVFDPEGMVTAGNASGLSDGAAAVVVSDAEWAVQAGLRPLARVVGYAQAAVEPLHLFTAPVLAIRKLLQGTGVAPAEVDLVELNEAFAAQVVANIRELRLDETRVNVNGGAIALGHPIGCSGARVLVTLLYALRARGLRRGIAALCLGGGEAVAMMVEML